VIPARRFRSIGGRRGVALVAAAVVAGSCGRDPERKDGNEARLLAAIAAVEAGQRTTPLIEQPEPGADASVTFLVNSPGDEAPRIVSDVTGWGESPDDSSFDMTIGTMTRIASTDWYRLETRVAPRARIEYLVVHGAADYRCDPHNPRRAWTRGGGPVSEFVTPDYVSPVELTEPPAPDRGAVIETTIESAALGGVRRVLVYLPPGYRDDGAYPVAVFHSGWRVARDGEAPRVLDWLVAHHRIDPIIGVFLESYLPGDADNHEGPPMRTFLTREAPTWTAQRFAVSLAPEDWAVLAISYGAKDALDAATAPAATYGRVGLLIPGRRLTPEDLETLARRTDRRLRVTILAGRYDAANLATAEAARSVLEGAGHAVDFIEVPEGHNASAWRNHLADVFVSLFGRSPGDDGSD
jgi:enterochelin esterase-like enzyme